MLRLLLAACFSVYVPPGTPNSSCVPHPQAPEHQVCVELRCEKTEEPTILECVKIMHQAQRCRKVLVKEKNP